ncbi:hypothetical protein RGE_39920 [Rubrivivax gelatinosus IL144]|uniref:Uncharacterized protein n=2 Tax=Rubrivivax gelatinosus TaxID=28068 RepID=I0HWE1_RUBGI|nr:hypothetical protein RGE_39920 [Rubrivivax gelatinosus IL144]
MARSVAKVTGARKGGPPAGAMRPVRPARIKAPMSDADPLENALAWFASAPERWRSDAEAVAEWVWVVLQGDFAENPTTAQTITGGLISMIPLVDQLSDLRDLVANVRALREDENDPWRWVALVLTLIGLFPTLGSLVKTGLKVVVAEARREVYRAAKWAYKGRNWLEGQKLWNETAESVERGIGRLDALLASAPMRKALAGLRIDEPYQYLSTEIRALAASLDAKSLRAAYDGALEVLEWLLEHVQRWGTAASGSAAGELLASLGRARDRMNDGLAQVLEPLRYWLACVARRLEVHGDMQYRAMVNARNRHQLVPTRQAFDKELEAIQEGRRPWVVESLKAPFPALKRAPRTPPGHFDIGGDKSAVIKNAFKSFSKRAIPDRLTPGTRLVRVVDPQSRDDSPFWMLESDFLLLKGKAEWREKLAVWSHWNGNGEYVIYVVPPGDGLPVWRGIAASQRLERSGEAVLNDAGQMYWLPGGTEQFVLNPANLDPAFLERRLKTDWGYANEEVDDLVLPIGVPVVKNNWGREVS